MNNVESLTRRPVNCAAIPADLEKSGVFLVNSSSEASGGLAGFAVSCEQWLTCYV